MLWLSGLAALGLSSGLTWTLIRLMKKIRLGQHIRAYGPDIHMHKQGTPTMGGLVFLLILGGFAALSAGLAPLSDPVRWTLWATLAFGGVGLLDDLMKFCRRDSLGLKARHKVGLQLALSGALFLAGPAGGAHALWVPGLASPLELEGGVLLLWLMLVFSGTTNAFNLTDGLDGLAGGIALIALVPLGIIAASEAQLSLVFLIVVFAASVLGFLWFNRHPARIFMGDTGSFALGAFVAAVAFGLGVELYLVLFALIPVIETVSVAVQVVCYRFTRRRVFKVAPLHHHFEAARGVDYPYWLPAVEWPETRITLSFWILSACGALLGLWLYLSG